MVTSVTSGCALLPRIGARGGQCPIHHERFGVAKLRVQVLRLPVHPPLAVAALGQGQVARIAPRCQQSRQRPGRLERHRRPAAGSADRTWSEISGGGTQRLVNGLQHRLCCSRVVRCLGRGNNVTLRPRGQKVLTSLLLRRGGG